MVTDFDGEKLMNKHERKWFNQPKGVFVMTD